MFAPSNRDLLLCCLLANLAVHAVAMTDNAVLRTLLCLPLAMFVCGHTLIRAIGILATSMAEHLAYAIGASLVVGIAGGLVLNAVGALSPLGWAAWFWLVVVGSSLTAIRGGREAASQADPFRDFSNSVRPWHVGAVVLSLLIATGGYALAVRDEAAQQQFKYTELWLLPADDGGRLKVGVRSGEETSQRFDLEVVLDGRALAAFRSLEIAPGETWAQELVVTPGATPRLAVARLYRPDDNRLYRRVSALLARS
ncbi:hypothetical protein IP86_18920 [Rhodopseudomonas sp. AAP120]|uniref:hypothetical protein n=1 Tax=Rhodopseudomonas sp. AAP120 TaxID=1523430 RepID=UPI0006B90828|nr:hypothetical protein [Rhodopseudomonas sp. AAP120]KPF95479.1 hypothetical protein IP86_18920 [Rhodopseudomonas sp. AAP120]